MLAILIVGALAAPLVILAIGYYYNVMVEKQIYTEQGRMRYCRAYDRAYEEAYYRYRSFVR